MRRLARIMISSTYRMVDLLSGSSTPAGDGSFSSTFTETF